MIEDFKKTINPFSIEYLTSKGINPITEPLLKWLKRSQVIYSKACQNDIEKKRYISWVKSVIEDASKNKNIESINWFKKSSAMPQSYVITKTDDEISIAYSVNANMDNKNNDNHTIINGEFSGFAAPLLNDIGLVERGNLYHVNLTSSTSNSYVNNGYIPQQNYNINNSMSFLASTANNHTLIASNTNVEKEILYNKCRLSAPMGLELFVEKALDLLNKEVVVMKKQYNSFKVESVIDVAKKLKKMDEEQGKLIAPPQNIQLLSNNLTQNQLHPQLFLPNHYQQLPQNHHFIPVQDSRQQQQIQQHPYALTNNLYPSVPYLFDNNYNNGANSLLQNANITFECDNHSNEIKTSNLSKRPREQNDFNMSQVTKTSYNQNCNLTISNHKNIKKKSLNNNDQKNFLNKTVTKTVFEKSKKDTFFSSLFTSHSRSWVKKYVDFSCYEESENGIFLNIQNNNDGERSLAKKVISLVCGNSNGKNNCTIGRSIALERVYSRDEPNEDDIRSLPILRNAFKHIFTNPHNYDKRNDIFKNSDNANNSLDRKGYLFEQLKGMRQDLRVQNIRNNFAVEVYEAHARLCLELGNISEFNQCQSALRDLYREGFISESSHFLPLTLKNNDDNKDYLNIAEFLSYRLVYLSLMNQEDTLAIELKEHEEMLHVLNLKSKTQKNRKIKNDKTGIYFHTRKKHLDIPEKKSHAQSFMTSQSLTHDCKTTINTRLINAYESDVVKLSIRLCICLLLHDSMRAWRILPILGDGMRQLFSIYIKKQRLNWLRQVMPSFRGLLPSLFILSFLGFMPMHSENHSLHQIDENDKKKMNTLTEAESSNTTYFKTTSISVKFPLLRAPDSVNECKTQITLLKQYLKQTISPLLVNNVNDSLTEQNSIKTINNGKNEDSTFVHYLDGSLSASQNTFLSLCKDIQFNIPIEMSFIVDVLYYIKQRVKFLRLSLIILQNINVNKKKNLTQNNNLPNFLSVSMDYESTLETSCFIDSLSLSNAVINYCDYLTKRTDIAPE